MWEKSGPPPALWVLLLMIVSFDAIRYTMAEWSTLEGLLIPHAGTWIGRDFTNLYIGGELLREGAPIYDNAAYRAELIARGITQWQNSSYPPTVYLVGVPLSYLPYPLALALWHGVGAVLFVLAARRHAAFHWGWLLLLPAMLAIPNGQYSLYTSALWLFAFSGSGLAAGILTIKPHLGLLMPVAMIARRRWHMIAIAVTVALGLLLAAELAFGQTLAFATSGVSRQVGVLLAEGDLTYFHAMPSTYVAFRESALAWPLHVAVAIIALWMVRPIFALPLKAQVFPLATATFLVLPYSFEYDMPVVTLGLLHFLWTGWGRRPKWEAVGFAVALVGLAHGGFPPAFLLLGLYLQRRVLLEGGESSSEAKR